MHAIRVILYGKTTVIPSRGGIIMLFVYPAFFHKEEGAYWVEFPDLEGCHTYGESLNETMEAAQEALAGYLLTLLEQRKVIASPSDISSIRMNGGFSSLVSCDINQYSLNQGKYLSNIERCWDFL